MLLVSIDVKRGSYTKEVGGVKLQMFPVVQYHTVFYQYKGVVLLPVPTCLQILW